eukprot:scaffold10787_cov123-Isochrysis_galbana.AAC.12
MGRVVRLEVAPVDALEALLRRGLHLPPEAQVLGHGRVAVGRRLLLVSQVLLLLLRRRVDEGEPLLEHARGDGHDLVEMVRGVRDGVGAEEHLALELLCEVGIEHGCLDMAYVQVPRRFGREAGDHLAHLGARERDLHGGHILGLAEERLRCLLERRRTVDSRPPALGVRAGGCAGLVRLRGGAEQEPDGRVGE